MVCLTLAPRCLSSATASSISFHWKEWVGGLPPGFVEQLSHALQRPLDAIIRNDAGALATRELLGQELARGRDRLNGKRVVLWEFAMRELATGNWEFVALKSPCAERNGFPRSRGLASDGECAPL